MQRRTLLTLGLGGTLMLGLGAWATGALQRANLFGAPWSASTQALFCQVASAVLAGSLPAAQKDRELALAAHEARLEALLAGLPQHAQDELSKVVALLTHPAGRYLLTGLRRPWPDASIAEVTEALDAMRTSPWSTRQQIYHALRDLTNAAFYADAAAWPLLGYPGPTEL